MSDETTRGAAAQVGKSRMAEVAVAERTEAVEQQDRACGGCRAFEPSSKYGGDVGECRRRAPVAKAIKAGADVHPDGFDAVWPNVSAADDWCCDFLPKEAPR